MQGKTVRRTAAAVVLAAAIGATSASGMDHSPPAQYLFAPNGANKAQYIHWLEGEVVISGCLFNGVWEDGSSTTRDAEKATKCMRRWHVYGQFLSHFAGAPAGSAA